ncbi:MBL fold metallo-hydrolase RNA specificity domain-containing protein [Parafilimonas terrae]|uniref:Metallo-beta-lactamase family protein n=1 Tax=Parafilimonas terrae TaxID=1465490 RepID=A0A1I5YWI1_9BACT|nr:MBL fold metallo-hydrolase [Parafilimonas terrae]SFQ48584.1 metallo-beta-lactamase family protein [Parafilimonas terrae]
MKIAFHGAARTVTGSKHLITLNNGKKILLDCGMFQGLGKDTFPLNNSFGFDAASVNYLLLSHAHIDHSGLIPKLVKEGFNGKIFCTPATKDLSAVLLMDSAEIQRDDTGYTNKKRIKKGLEPYDPLYDISDVQKAMPLFTIVNYNNWFTVDEGIKVLYTDTGHITGSAAVHVRITENGVTRQISFSGDVGRYNDMILRKPETFPQADYIITESTYGNSLHQRITNTAEDFYEWIESTCIHKKGKLIIPAFSVGRTQELLYLLNELSLEKQLKGIPVFVDSPLSYEATTVVKQHPENFNINIQELLKRDDDPFTFPELKFIENVDESKRLNDDHRPMIIIAASGMADAGRIKHHIKNNIGNNRNTILIVGYCEPGSLGGALMNNVKRVRIFSEEFDVIAQVGVMRSMSAHGDYNDLLQFLKCQQPEAVNKVFIVHGEYKVQIDFREKLQKAGFKNVFIPALHQEFILE